MTTATMEKQTKTQPAPEAPPLAADSRAGRFCLALDAMTNPAAYLAPPPPGTAFGDLMAVWETGIEPNTARPLFASLDDLASERRSKLGGASLQAPATVLAGKLTAAATGDSRRAELKDRLGGLLEEVETRLIPASLDRGEGDGTVVDLRAVMATAFEDRRVSQPRDVMRVVDAASFGMTPVVLSAVYPEYLPDGHPLRQIREDHLLQLGHHAGGSKGVTVLGPQLPALRRGNFDMGGTPRPWYSTYMAHNLTMLLRRAQVQRRSNYEGEYREDREKADELLRTAGREGRWEPPQPRPLPALTGWADRATFALRVLREPQWCLRELPDGTHFHDLLDVRLRLVDRVADEAEYHVKAAAHGFVSRVCGPAAAEDLEATLKAFVGGVDREIKHLTRAGIVWAISQAQRARS